MKKKTIQIFNWIAILGLLYVGFYSFGSLFAAASDVRDGALGMILVFGTIPFLFTSSCIAGLVLTTISKPKYKNITQIFNWLGLLGLASLTFLGIGGSGSEQAWGIMAVIIVIILWSLLTVIFSLRYMSKLK